MKEIKGACHCGSVEFRIEVEKDLGAVRRCNCSLCRRKGAIMASVPLARLTVTKGEECLTLYQWNTHTAKHYFCRICGIYTHHKRRSVPTEYGVNIACLEGIDPFAFDEVLIGNGAAQ